MKKWWKGIVSDCRDWKKKMSKIIRRKEKPASRPIDTGSGVTKVGYGNRRVFKTSELKKA